MGQFTDYSSYVDEQAQDLFNDYKSSFDEQLKDGYVEVYEFFDDALFQWVDNDFIYVNLKDAADILDQSNNVEEDSGLWEGQEPRKAIETQAFFTYRTDLWYSLKGVVHGYLEELEAIAKSTIEDAQNELDALEEKLADIEAEEDTEPFETDIADLESDIETAKEKLEEAEAYLSNIQDTM